MLTIHLFQHNQLLTLRIVLHFNNSLNPNIIQLHLPIHFNIVIRPDPKKDQPKNFVVVVGVGDKEFGVGGWGRDIFHLLDVTDGLVDWDVVGE